MRIPKITSLCPGGEWFAVYLLEADPWISLDRVVVFGVGRPEEYHGTYPRGRYTSEETDAVEGFVVADGILDPASDCTNFHTYVHANDLTEAMKARLVNEARARVEREQKRKAA